MSSILKSNDHVAGGYVNACVQVEHALSPYANNVNTYPFLENHLFSDYCGFTRKEVDELLQRPAFTGFCADAIGRHYNGYKIFGYNQDIYCTYSVLKYLFNWEECRKKKKDANLPSPPKEKHTPSHCWIESHGVGKLEHIFQIEEVRELIKKSLNKEVIDINVSGTKMSADQVLSLQNILNCVADPSTDQVHLLFLYLKDRGYFNVTEKTFFGLKLKIPNVEVRTELFKKLRNAEYTRLRKCFNGADINKYTDALIGLKINDPQTFQQLAESVATLFSKRPPRNHDEIQSPLYTFAANKWPVGSMHSEVLALEGRLFRMDLLFLRGGTGTIVEIKIGNQKLNSAENALKQIFDSHYYNAFYEKNSSKTKPEITKQKFFVGLNYNQGTVTICAWATEAKKVVTQWDKIPKDKLIRAKSSVSENEK